MAGARVPGVRDRGLRRVRRLPVFRCRQHLLPGGVALVPITIGIAVLRYRLYEIDRILSRTVSYTLLVALLAGVFFGGVTLLTDPYSPTTDLVTAGSHPAGGGPLQPGAKKGPGVGGPELQPLAIRRAAGDGRVRRSVARSGRQRSGCGWLGRGGHRDHAAEVGFGLGEAMRSLYKLGGRGVGGPDVCRRDRLAGALLGKPRLVAGVLAASVGAVLVGAILTLKVPSNSVGPLSLIAGSAWVIYLFGNAYAVASLGDQGPFPGAYLFGWAGAWTGALFAIGLTTLILVFPTGKPFGWWRVFLIAPAAAAVAILIGAVLLWGLPLETLVDQDRSASSSLPADRRRVHTRLPLGNPCHTLGGCPLPSRRVRRAPADQVAAGGHQPVRRGLCHRRDVRRSNETFWWVLSFALLAIPLAILFAVLRYGLYEIDRIVSRSVSYAIVVGLLAAVFFGTVTLLTSVLSSDSDLVTAVATSSSLVCSTRCGGRSRDGWIVASTVPDTTLNWSWTGLQEAFNQRSIPTRWCMVGCQLWHPRWSRRRLEFG